MRQPAFCCSTTLAAASAKLGTPCARRFSASGSPPLAGQLAVGPRLLPCLGERDQGDAAEPEFSTPSANDEALDPAAGSGGLDVEVQPVAVGVSAGRSGADEGGRQGVVGMAALGLGLPWLRGRVSSSTHPHIMLRVPRHRRAPIVPPFAPSRDETAAFALYRKPPGGDPASVGGSPAVRSPLPLRAFRYPLALGAGPIPPIVGAPGGVIIRGRRSPARSRRSQRTPSGWTC